MTKDAGTVQARQNHEYKFTTKLGNVVKVYFRIDGDDSYDVVFYVNDTLDDESSKTADNTRDPEILSGVLHIIQTKANTLKAKKITFSAYSGKGDTKTKYGLPTEPAIQKMEKLLQSFEQTIRNHKVTMTPPSQARIDLYAKLGKPSPEPMPDLNVPAWLKNISEFRESVKQGHLHSVFDQFVSSLHSTIFQTLGIDTSALAAAVREVEGAMWSNTQYGWKQTKNRREGIYAQLMQRYFSDWKIEKSGTNFTLTK